MAFDNIKFTIEGAQATLTISREKALNALNIPTLQEMETALHELDGNTSVRALVLTGAGDRAFIAGADISQMRGFDQEQAKAFSALGHKVLHTLETLPIPVIAAVNGFALGGGTEVLLACDLAYAATNAKFGQPEVKLGVIPGFGGTQRLPRLVGPAMAKELIYSGRIIDADEALRIGRVNRVEKPEDLLPSVSKLVSEISEAGPLAVGAAKQVMREGAHLALVEANEMEKLAFAELFNSDDQGEGMDAFLHKRKAEFKGC